jgi:hypothetical protein
MKTEDIQWERVRDYDVLEPTMQNFISSLKYWSGDDFIVSNRFGAVGMTDPDDNDWLVWQNGDGTFYRYAGMTAEEKDREREHAAAEYEREMDEWVAERMAQVEEFGLEEFLRRAYEEWDDR